MRLPLRMLMIGGIVTMAYLLSLARYGSEQTQRYDRGSSRDTMESWANLPLAENDHFKTSGNCDGCHGHDETGFASVDGEGHDISPVTTWRAGMMANAARDPFYLAKVSHEGLINPQHQQALEDKCLTCHAPLGRFTYHLDSNGPYGLSDLDNDLLGLDGVSCMACHKQTDENLGNNHSGNLNYADTMMEFGPFQKPFQAPMQDFIGVTPEYSPHVTKAGFCAGCHSLLTNSVDLQGNFTGTTFVEQATYHEWLNSSYNQQGGGVTCQDCHMPSISDGVVIAANYLILEPRSPYGKHDLAGGNSFMLKLMKTHRQQLDIRAGEAHFDSTIARTLRNLQQRSVVMELEHDGSVNDTALFSVSMRNLTGHKFPSGYPSRRAFVEFVVLNQHNDTLFSSGVLNADHGLDAENAGYEPHYNTIVSQDQVQIYEMVMGDVNGDVTTVLERAYQHLKDNRLVPLGFTTSHAVYDTVAMVGNATADPDFNFDGFGGSGTDVVHFRVPIASSDDTLTVSARLYYQSVPKKWVQDMLAQSTPRIDTFATMFSTADHTPVLVAADTLSGVPVTLSVEDHRLPQVAVYPNPSRGVVWLQGLRKEEVSAIGVYTTDGRRVGHYGRCPSSGIPLPDRAGLYLVRVRTEDGERVFRVVRE